MFDTYAAAHMVDRDLVLRRAERLAPLLTAAKRPGSAPTGLPTRTRLARTGRVADAVRSLRRVLRPAYA